jgi:hypothetical protein
MEPLILAALLGGILLAMLVSPTVRSLLRAIFRRPRETSVIISVGGKRLELSGDPEAITAAIEGLYATRQEDGSKFPPSPPMPPTFLSQASLNPPSPLAPRVSAFPPPRHQRPPIDLWGPAFPRRDQPPPIDLRRRAVPPGDQPPPRVPSPVSLRKQDLYGAAWRRRNPQPEAGKRRPDPQPEAEAGAADE